MSLWDGQGRSMRWWGISWLSNKGGLEGGLEAEGRGQNLSDGELFQKQKRAQGDKEDSRMLNAEGSC